MLFFVFRNYKKQTTANRILKETQEQLIETEKSAALQSVRIKISQDLHDDIGSALSSINIYSEVVKKMSEEKNKDAVSLLENLQYTTRSAMENMNDIVWAINPANDKFSNIMERIEIFANQLLGVQDVHMVYNIANDFNDVKLSMQQRKNVYLICKEALNNAAKYADAKNCIVEILRNENKVSIRISDDGKVMDDESSTLGGNGLLNMHKRAEELKGKFDISSKKNNGTILSLTFAL